LFANPNYLFVPYPPFDVGDLINRVIIVVVVVVVVTVVFVEKESTPLINDTTTIIVIATRSMVDIIL